MGSASCQPPDPTGVGDTIVSALVSSILAWGARRLYPEAWQSWQVDGYDGLLTGAQVLDLLDASREALAPRSRSGERSAQR